MKLVWKQSNSHQIILMQIGRSDRKTSINASLSYRSPRLPSVWAQHPQFWQESVDLLQQKITLLQMNSAAKDFQLRVNSALSHLDLWSTLIVPIRDVYIVLQVIWICDRIMSEIDQEFLFKKRIMMTRMNSFIFLLFFV